MMKLADGCVLKVFLLLDLGMMLYGCRERPRGATQHQLRYIGWCYSVMERIVSIAAHKCSGIDTFFCLK